MRQFTAESFSGIFHIVHVSLMSQESEKFPLRSILYQFSESPICMLRLKFEGQCSSGFPNRGRHLDLRPPESRSTEGNLYRYPYKLIPELIPLGFSKTSVRDFLILQTHTSAARPRVFPSKDGLRLAS